MDKSFDELLKRWGNGDPAAGEEFLTLAYRELRRVAAIHFRRERPGHTLQPTALVNEVFIKLFNGKPVQWQNKAHFYAVFSRKVRLFLVDYARSKKETVHNSQIEWIGRSGPRLENILTVDRALRELDKEDPRAARVVEMRVFLGLRDGEMAETLGVSPATVKRDWTYARAFLKSRMTQP
jgi:RNA polymerase sigma factor (TIGR02999 family)